MPVREGPDDTIAAIATPPGRGGIGVIRVSGPRALEALGPLWRGRPGPADFEDRRVYTGRIGDTDRVVAFRMAAPRSYTGEEVVEIQAHGGPRVLELILEEILRQGVRLAAPGEFTQRAYLHGKLDLPQAEAVADLIAASSAAAVRAAARQLEGSLSRKVNRLRSELLVMKAQMEAMIDFPEDEDVQGLKMPETIERVDRVEGQIRALIASYKEGRALREGIRVAIVGKPNVGKSSLLNALLEEERAIVHPQPGTTRDTVEETVEIGGLPIRLIDTAGIRSGGGEVEEEGIRRSRSRISEADWVLLVVDSSRPLDQEDEAVFEAAAGRPAAVVYNKTDLPAAFPAGSLQSRPGGQEVLRVSALKRTGLESVREALRRRFLPQEGSGEVVLTNLRHRVALESALPSLARLRVSAGQGLSLEFLAADLQEAADRLSEVTGEITTDEVLSEIFSRFCIGK